MAEIQSWGNACGQGRASCKTSQTAEASGTACFTTSLTIYILPIDAYQITITALAERCVLLPCQQSVKQLQPDMPMLVAQASCATVCSSVLCLEVRTGPLCINVSVIAFRVIKSACAYPWLAQSSCLHMGFCVQLVVPKKVPTPKQSPLPLPVYM